MTRNLIDKVAVASRSFSSNAYLRQEILRRYERVVFNDSGSSLSPQQLVELLRGCTKAITALDRVSDELLMKLPELKVIGKYGVGTDMLDLVAMEKRGVMLGWTPGVNRRSVAELALCFMLSALRLVPHANYLLRAGSWKQVVGRQLTEKKVGIIGCGNVGQELVKLLQPFNCTIYCFDREIYPDIYEKYQCTPLPLDELLSNSDVVSVHLPLTASTKGILSKEKLLLMKKHSILINTARGGLVDETIVAEMLASGHLAGAAFDVFETEPTTTSDLIHLPNVLSTPHIGGSAEESIIAMGLAAIDGLDNYDRPFRVTNNIV